jgi:pimeloyl-ACP methyl ester carboxylesterase
MPSIAVDGAELHYVEVGSGTPLVLVHGTSGNADAWLRVMPLLAARFRVIGYDRRAHQRSSGTPPPPRGYYARHGADLSALLRALDAEPAIVLGWSAGAFPVMHAALAQPQQFRQIVIYEPPFHAKRHPSRALLKTFARVFWLRLIGQPKRAVEVFQRMAMAYTDGRNSYDTLPAEHRERMGRDQGALLAELAAGTGEELGARQLANGLRMPVKLLLGERSPPLFTEAMQRLQRVFPAAPLVTIPGGNHLAQVDRPENFVGALLRAIDT